MNRPRCGKSRPRFALETLETRLTPSAFSPAASWATAMRARPEAPALVAPAPAETTPTTSTDSVLVQWNFRVRARPILHITPNIPFDPASGPPRLGSPIGVGAVPWIEASPDGSSYRVGATPTFSITPSIPFDPAAGPPDLGPPIGLHVETEVEIDIPMRPFDPQNPTVNLGPTIHLVGPSKFKLNLVAESSLWS